MIMLCGSVTILDDNGTMYLKMVKYYYQVLEWVPINTVICQFPNSSAALCLKTKGMILPLPTSVPVLFLCQCNYRA